MYLGDLAVGQTINFKFSTHDNTGAPVALLGTPTVTVYKADGTTKSTAGVTLTVSLDGIVGMNNVKIDTSADGSFYSANSGFGVILTAGTVQSTPVAGAVLGAFSIQNRYNYAAPDIALIKAKTDNLPADPASNTQVNTRMATFTYTAPDNTTIGLINAKTTNLPSDPADESAVEAAILASQAVIVAAIATAGAGTGPIEWVATIEDTSNNPLDGVQIIISTLSGTLVAGGYTNAMGNATFYLDAGTYRMIRNLSGYNFPVVEITVS
jgi:hypothetical protein